MLFLGMRMPFFGSIANTTCGLSLEPAANHVRCRCSDVDDLKSVEFFIRRNNQQSWGSQLRAVSANASQLCEA